MTQKNPSGYPLPSGELGDDEIVCQLVYLPDRPEYWQALLGALSYMATWKAWERDTDKRGKDAAANWYAAYELTLECWRMACLEDITDRMDLLYDLLVNKKDCCDDNVTYLPVEEIETDIVPNVGDPPDYYGETAVADWDEWMEYLCYTAHKYVDYLAHVGENLRAAIISGGLVVGVVGSALVLASFAGLIIAFPFAAIITIIGGILLIGTTAIFDDSEADIEAARDEIVCAIINDGDIGDAVEAALGSDTAWDVFYSQIPYETAKAIMYEGGHDGEYLPAETRQDCDTCDYDQLTDDDLYLEMKFGSVVYDEPTKTWEAQSDFRYGCEGFEIRFWEDDTKAVEVEVLMLGIACDGVDSRCAGELNSRGMIDTVDQWYVDHPDLPDLDNSVIDRFIHIHVHTGSPFFMSFKLYQ